MPGHTECKLQLFRARAFGHYSEGQEEFRVRDLPVEQCDSPTSVALRLHCVYSASTVRRQCVCSNPTSTRASLISASGDAPSGITYPSPSASNRSNRTSLNTSKARERPLAPSVQQSRACACTARANAYSDSLHQTRAVPAPSQTPRASVRPSRPCPSPRTAPSVLRTPAM